MSHESAVSEMGVVSKRAPGAKRRTDWGWRGLADKGNERTGHGHEERKEERTKGRKEERKRRAEEIRVGLSVECRGLGQTRRDTTRHWDNATGRRFQGAAAPDTGDEEQKKAESDRGWFGVSGAAVRGAAVHGRDDTPGGQLQATADLRRN